MELIENPDAEKARLQALRTYRILDTAQEESFDRIVELIALICETPIAAISLVDSHREWIKASVGLSQTESPREGSFCTLTVDLREFLMVEDTLLDERFKSSPLVVKPPFVRFYAGFPLVDSDGFALGALCVKDVQPRSLSPVQKSVLQILARDVVAHLVARKVEIARHSYESLFNMTLDLVGIASTDGFWKKVNPRFFAVLGWEESEFLGRPFSEFIHPEDRSATFTEVEKLSQGQTTIDFVNRYRAKDGSYRHIKWSANPDPATGDLFAIGQDITLRLEEERRQNLEQERTRFALEASGDGVWDWNPTEAKTEYSKQWLKMLGYSQGDLNSNDSEWRSRIHPDDLEATLQVIGKSLSGDADSFHCEYRFRNAQGSFQWMLNRGRVIERDNEGRAVRVVGTHTDLSVQKEQQRKLQESEKRLIDAQRLSGTGDWTSDFVTKAISWSAGLCEIYEVDENLAPEKRRAALAKIMHPDDLAASNQRVQEALATGQDLQSEYRLVFDGGTRIKTVLSRGRIVKDQAGTPVAMVGTVQDITEARIRDQELAEIRDSLRITLDTVSEGLVTQDSEGRIVNCNPAAESILGLTVAQMSGKSSIDPLWRSVHEDGSPFPGERHPAMVALATKQPVHNVVMGVHKPSGALTWININSEVLPGGRGVVTSFTEITDQRRVERELVSERDRADTANKAKSEFLANMSHEIRTPLNSVIGFTDLLTQTPLSDTQRQYAENALHSGQALLSIINDILDFSKIEAGKLELELVETNVHELVEQVCDILKFSVAQKGLELLLNVAPTVPQVFEIDPVRLKQILINLLSNAVKFTSAGEVELKLTAQRASDTFYDLTFSVRDTGIGISESEQTKLFKVFSQADSSTTRRFGGTGLGLVISGLLAEKMGGKIGLSSEPDVGSEFSFTLRLQQKQGPSLPRMVPKIKRVLAIDDNWRNLSILQDSLKFHGIEVVTVLSGGLALELMARDTDFDALIIDYNMPEMNGLQTVERLNEVFLSKKIPRPVILLYSSSDLSELNEVSKRVGVDHTLNKPVKAKELLAHLENVSTTSARQVSSPVESELVPAEGAVHSILLVEDVALNLQLIRIFVRKLLPRANLIEAMSGESAVDLAREMHFHLILMDVQMPGMSGLEATRAIRGTEGGKSRRVPIVALSAGALKEEVASCLASGMNGFLAKPINPADLKKVINQFVVQGTV